jgi:hypothetical protein
MTFVERHDNGLFEPRPGTISGRGRMSHVGGQSPVVAGRDLAGDEAGARSSESRR